MSAVIIYEFPRADKVTSLPYEKSISLRYHLHDLMNQLVDKYEAGEPARITLEIKAGK